MNTGQFVYSSRRGFTLVELLVVVSIIVVLLALLAPALDTAIYRAGNLKVMATGVMTYAFQNKRYYPDRGLADLKHRGDDPAALPVNPQTVKRASRNYDMRTIHREIFPINKTLQCPMSPHIELEDYTLENQDMGLDASYAMFWAWQYKEPGKSFRGMFKVGDRFEYEDLENPNNDLINRYSVLAGDIDLMWGGGGNAVAEARPAQASHPDRDPPVMSELKVEGEWFIERGSVGRWWGPSPRGLLDTNYVFDDGSAALYEGVTGVQLPWNSAHRDKRMARVPINYNVWNNRGVNVDKMHIPRR
jgi:prepilin-type N-terminal cleavage/methylation domain-containing protein